MSEDIVNVPKKVFKPDIMEYNPSSNTRIKSSTCLRMTDTVFLLCPDLRRKEKDQPTDLSDFQAKRANKPFIFFRPYQSGMKFYPQ